jgi:phosphoribosylpyrophosphate synthetase
MVARTAVIADSAKNYYGAKKVTAIMTELPFARQDKNPLSSPKLEGEAFTVRTVAKILHACNVDRVLTVHMHSQELYRVFEEEFKRPGKDVLYNISPAPLVAYYLMRQSSLDISNGGEKVCFISPDQNARKFVEELRTLMGLPNATTVYFEKAREVPNKPEAVTVKIINHDELKRKNFSFDGKYLIYADDSVDTGGTLIKTRNWIYGVFSELDHGLGRPAGIYYYFTHAVNEGEHFKENQEKLVKRLPAIEYICSNTRPYISDQQSYRFKERCSVIRVATLISDAILNCCMKNIYPEDYYHYNSFEELERAIKAKGFNHPENIKRSSRHLMNRGINMISTFQA